MWYFTKVKDHFNSLKSQKVWENQVSVSIRDVSRIPFTCIVTISISDFLTTMK